MTEKPPAMTLEYILLGLLRDRPNHGYALYERIQNTPELSLIWTIKRSKLYYLLEKLADEGLLLLSVRAQGGYPDRKIYQITPQGERAFLGWLDDPVRISRNVRIAFLSKLYFALQIEVGIALDLIDKQLEVCRGWLQNLEEEASQIASEDFISSQVYQFRIGQITAMINWLNNCRKGVST